MILEAAHSAPPSAAANVHVRCPVCVIRTGKPDHRGSLSIEKALGLYYCHKCGVSGCLDGAEHADRLPPASKGTTTFEPPETFHELATEPGLSAKAFAPARAYLRRRGLSVSVQRQAHVGACLGGRFGGRVVVPVIGPRGVWLGYVGRAWGEAEMKYRYPLGMERAGLLYNRSAIWFRTGEPVLVVEGVLDALAVWPHGVAVLGKPSDAQIMALSRARRPVVVVFDGDAWEEAEMAAVRLRLEGARSGAVHLPPKVDPDEVPLDWLLAKAREAIA